MRDFSDAPYQWFPPRYRPPVAWLMKRLNHACYLRRVQRVDRVEVLGLETLRAMRRESDRLLLLPNHPTHSDAYILVDLLRQAGVRSLVMCAYDVFLRGRLDSFAMQSLGCFSVDREGSDPKAMKEAMATLERGDFALTIFPEGNVYLQNDLVTPFNEGAAFLALKAFRELCDKNVSCRMLAVPVSIKVSHVTDVRPRLREEIAKLAAALEVELSPDLPPQTALKRIGVAALRRNLKLRGHDVDLRDDAPLREVIAVGADAVLDRLEAKLELKNGGDDPPIERVRRVRRAVHEIRTDPARAADHRAAVSLADEAMIAFRIASYTDGYLLSKPTVDRVAETVEKLHEDIFDRAMPSLGPRRAFVRVNEPIDAAPYAAEKKLRVGVERLTRDVEAAVQRGLDTLNAATALPGARLWAEPG